MDEMGRGEMAQPFALSQRVIDQPEVALGQIPQASMNQLRGVRRGCRREVAFVDHRGLETTHRCIARHRRPDYSTSDNCNVESFSL
jgi:hypothetical protein